MTAGRTGGPSACLQASGTTRAVCCSVWLPLARHLPLTLPLTISLQRWQLLPRPEDSPRRARTPSKGNILPWKVTTCPFRWWTGSYSKPAFVRLYMWDHYLFLCPSLLLIKSFFSIHHALRYQPTTVGSWPWRPVVMEVSTAFYHSYNDLN